MTITDVTAILGLVLLEGALSLDNAVVLAVMVQHLPRRSRKRALTYGIAGAFAFRFVALFFVSALMKAYWFKMLGALYLIWLAGSHFKGWLFEFGEDKPRTPPPRTFWHTVVMVEFMDICFSIDSILAAVAVSRKLWIVIAGGLLGIVMMRFAAQIFTRLLDRLPWLVHVAYGLVGLAGVRLGLQ